MSRLSSLSRRVIALAMQNNITVGTAESLTGGMIASSLASVAGASQVLMGGIISYDSRVKRELLAVPQDLIDEAGVVSDPCARQMALGAKALLAVDIAVSATGLAGPGGGTAETPVGTVFFGIVGKGTPRTVRRRFRGSRQTVRRKAAKAALQMILDEIQFSS